MKKRTVFTIIFVCLAAVAIGIGFFAVKKKEEKERSEEQKSVYTLLDSAYAKAAVPLGVKLYDSGVDGLFYSLSPVQYYGVENGIPTLLKPAGKMQLNPTVGTAKMRLNIPYVKRGGTIFGVGLWHSDAGIYTNAFAVVTNMPKALGGAAYLLMIDTAPGDASATERTYSEMFAVGADGKLGDYIFDRRNITPEESGKLRTDWNVLKLSCLQGFSGGVPSLTGKKYHRDPAAQTYDLCLSDAGDTAVVAENITDAFIGCGKEGVLYIRQGLKNWSLLSYNGKRETKVASFEGNIREDYRVFDSFAVRKADNAVIDLNSGQEVAAFQDYKAIYALARTQEKMICIGKEANRDGADFKVQRIEIADSVGTVKQTIYANDIMDENSSLLVCGSGILTQKNAKSVYISFDNIATELQNVVQ